MSHDSSDQAADHSSQDRRDHRWRAKRFRKLFAATMLGPFVTIIGASTMRQNHWDGRSTAMGFAAIVLIWAIAMYFWVQRWFRNSVDPIDQLADHIERIAAIDDLNRFRVPKRTNDTVGRLARCIQESEERLAQQFGALKNNYRKMSVLMRTMDEIIIAVDGERRLVFGNQAAEKMFGFDATRTIGEPVLHVIRNRVFEQAIDRCLESGESARTEMITSDVAKRCFSIRATSFSGLTTLTGSGPTGANGNAKGVLMVLHDISELRRLENLRQEFVANVSHELKTPLSSIKAYSETLRIGAINDPENNLHFVNQIEMHADRLQALIGDMLQIARVESGEESFEVTSIDLHELVEQCRRNHAATADAKQIRVIAEPPMRDGEVVPIRVMADQDGMRSIMDNLIGNAITYTPASGQITISWKRKSDEDSWVVIEVTDTGIGIKSEDQRRIFERFYRVDRARSREIGGTGLGLSIVKHLSHAFGGSVSLQSTPGVGSTFSVHLPLANQLIDDS